MADFDQLPGESVRAYAAFRIYRDLPPQQRSLRAVSSKLADERRGSGLRIVGDAESTERAPRGYQKTGRVGFWSRKFRWRERVASWDQLIDQRLRERALDSIERMAARHAAQAELALDDLMKPVLAFAKAMQNQERRAAFENLSVFELFKLCLSACALLPRLHQAERLAHGCRVVSNDKMSTPACPQGPSEWRVTVYQPPRQGPTPEDVTHARRETDEWEEADETAA